MPNGSMLSHGRNAKCLCITTPASRRLKAQALLWSTWTGLTKGMR